MIKYLKRLLLINIYIIFVLIIFVFFVFFLINLTVSGQPRYWEILHGSSMNNFRIIKEKLVQYKSLSKYKKFLKITDIEYKKIGYTGDFINLNCGAIENGNYETIYQNDKYGYRENLDERHISSNYVLLGDSFTESVCENKPWDLKSALIKKSDLTYLNLGVRGTDFPLQAKHLMNTTINTKFNGLIWFFYEGNDYEHKIDNNFFNDIKLKEKNNKNLKNSINYDIKKNHNIEATFKFKVWFAEFIRGPATLIRYFNNYGKLLDKDDYDLTLKQISKFLDKKKIDKRYIVYIPSWQKISLYKIKKIPFLKNHPQLKQFQILKDNVKAIAVKNNFNFIDGDDIFFNQKKPLSVFHYELNTHFNSRGYELLSQIVDENLN